VVAGPPDSQAPAAPTGLSAAAADLNVTLTWNANGEPDLAGYRVYRTDPGGLPEKVAEVGGTRASWLDATARRGVVYRYAVTAFDQAGNESEPAEPVEASLP